jgi:hypothetical protein
MISVNYECENGVAIPSNYFILQDESRISIINIEKESISSLYDVTGNINYGASL